MLRLDYGGQFATVHPNQESLREWLNAFDGDPPPLFVHNAWRAANAFGLVGDQVCYDLIGQARETLAQLDGVGA